MIVWLPCLLLCNWLIQKASQTWIHHRYVIMCYPIKTWDSTRTWASLRHFPQNKNRSANTTLIWGEEKMGQMKCTKTTINLKWSSMLKIKRKTTAIWQTKGAGQYQVRADFTHFCVYLLLWAMKTHPDAEKILTKHPAISWLQISSNEPALSLGSTTTALELLWDQIQVFQSQYWFNTQGPHGLAIEMFLYSVTQ